jgi:hypothetical protein
VRRQLGAPAEASAELFGTTYYRLFLSKQELSDYLMLLHHSAAAASLQLSLLSLDIAPSVSHVKTITRAFPLKLHVKKQHRCERECAVCGLASVPLTRQLCCPSS